MLIYLNANQKLIKMEAISIETYGWDIQRSTGADGFNISGFHLMIVIAYTDYNNLNANANWDGTRMDGSSLDIFWKSSDLLQPITQ